MNENNLGKEITLEEKIVSILLEKKWTITTAESCTAGLISATLVNVPGSSQVFNESYVTYSNNSKIKLLNVKREILEKHGAVSSETAQEMARGAARVADAEVAISATGIAGPDGGTPEKPVGLVYIGLYICGDTTTKKCYFEGSREQIRLKTVENVLSLLLENLQ